MVSGREKTAFDRLKQSVDFALGEVLKPDPVFPEKVTNGINTSMDEYFPSITVDGSTLIFTRQEWLFSSGRKIPGQEDLFQISWKAGETRFPLRFDYPVNTPGNEGTVSVRQDGRTMLFTACNRPDSKGGCDIYLAVRTGEVWEKPYNLGYPVNTRYWESTPFLAADGLTLYFSSNRPGGRGGMDLWKSSLKNDGSWTEPVNLGPVINTEGNEIAPFMLPEGTNLYFASDGHPGMGGFDLFRSGVSGKAGWEIPVNLGYPVNTWHNEEGITMPGDPEFAIISSDRDSLTGKDLYLLKLPREKRPPKSVVIRGIVQNALDGSPVGAEVEIVSLEGENSSRVVSDEISGEYLLGLPVSKSYRLNVNRQGFLFYSGRVLADTIQSRTEIQWDILLQPIRPGASITLNNIYFALDSYELLPESGGELTELTRLLKDNPSMLIEICGHTDSTGSREYNLELSRKRAESVMNHLVMQGIDSKRLSVRGFGDSRPVADNDTEEGRSKNRRTEVRIL
jgi:outer membrane protein OmpA-like peptidoglycan-associated protein